ALVQLRRRSRNLAGYGWAVTGLCTGPMPMLVGGLMILVVGLQFLGSSVVRVHVQSNGSPMSGAALGTPATEPSTISGKVAQGESDFAEVAPARHNAPLDDVEQPRNDADEPVPSASRRPLTPRFTEEEPSARPA